MGIYSFLEDKKNINETYKDMNNTFKQDKILQGLKQAYEEDTLTLFVGAGVSKTVFGTNAKLWPDLVKKMQVLLKSDETDPLRLAQMLSKKDYKKYMELAKKAIDSQGNISSVHQLIAKLKPRIVITTNWDCLLEKVLIFPWYDTITCDEDLLQSRQSHKLIKMHGDFAGDGKKFVFKEDDYLNYSYNYPLIETFIKNTLVTTNVLFIGYSYSDINLKMIMSWLKQNRKQKQGEYPLHVIAQFKAIGIQTKYYLNWGIKTYICRDMHKPADTLNLLDDKKHYSYRLYNFLNEIYSEKNSSDIYSLWQSYKLFITLPAVHFKFITNFLPKSEIVCYRASDPILNIFSDQRYPFNQTLYEQLEQYVVAKTQNDEKILHELPDILGYIIDFLRKAGISYISNNYYHIVEPQKIIKINNIQNDTSSYYENVSDVEDWLSFKKTFFDKSFNEQESISNIISLFKDNKLAESLVENSRLHFYHLLNTFGQQDTPDLYIGDVSEIIEILPKHLQKKYSVLADILTFKDIKDKSLKLNAKIREKLESLTQRKIQGKVSFNNTDSYVERAELLNYLRFFWLTNLCVKYYKEVKEYVYLSLKYVFCLYFYKCLSCIMDNKQFEQCSNNPPPISLMRFELSALLHFADKKTLEELLDRNTYLLDGTVKLDISSENIFWLIGTVLPNLLFHAKEPINIIDGTAWTQRVSFVFKLLAVSSQIDTVAMNKIFDSLLSEKIFLKEPFTILPEISFFFKCRNTDLADNSESAAKFIISFLQMSVKFLTEEVHNPYTLKAVQEVFSIASFFISYTADKIPEEIVDAIVEYYLSLDLEYKCHCIQCLYWICAVTNDDKKRKIGEKINSYLNDIDEHPINSIMYVIFRIYLVHFQINSLTTELLTEISSNKDFRQKIGNWNSNTDWLLSLLNELVPQTTDPIIVEQLNNAIRALITQ